MGEAHLTKIGYDYVLTKKSKYTKITNENFPTNSRTDKMGLKILGAYLYTEFSSKIVSFRILSLCFSKFRYRFDYAEKRQPAFHPSDVAHSARVTKNDICYSFAKKRLNVFKKS